MGNYFCELFQLFQQFWSNSGWGSCGVIDCSWASPDAFNLDFQLEKMVMVTWHIHIQQKLNQFTDNIILRTIKLKLRYKKIKFFFPVYFLYCVDQFTGSWFVGSVWLIFPSEDCFIFPDSLWWRWWLFCPIDDLSEDPRDQFSAPIAQAKDKQPILV